MAPWANECIIKAIREHDTVDSKGWFGYGSAPSARTTSVGVSIDTPVTQVQAETSIAALTEYLNRNFEILCVGLTPQNAQEAIKLLWGEVLVIFENAILPQLHGAIESNRRRLNQRQLSAVEILLEVRFGHLNFLMTLPYPPIPPPPYLNSKNI